MQVTRLTLPTLALATLGLIAHTAQPANAGDGVGFSSTRIASQTDITPSSACRDLIPSAPVVIMTTAGATLLGPTMQSVSIYSDGLVIMSEASGLNGASSASQSRIDASVVANLSRNLQELGAFRQCDDMVRAYDIPLTTMTVFDGGASAKAHTYSYWLGDDEKRAIRDAIEVFVLQEVL